GASGSTEKAIEKRQQQRGLDAHEGKDGQGLHAHDGERGRRRQRSLQIGAFHRIQRIELHDGVAAQQSGQCAAGAGGEMLADFFEQRQLGAIYALRREIVGPHRGFLAALLKERCNFFVGYAFRRLHHHCTTKLVKSTSSTSGPPSFFWTA